MAPVKTVHYPSSDLRQPLSAGEPGDFFLSIDFKVALFRLLSRPLFLLWDYFASRCLLLLRVFDVSECSMGKCVWLHLCPFWSPWCSVPYTESSHCRLRLYILWGQRKGGEQRCARLSGFHRLHRHVKRRTTSQPAEWKKKVLVSKLLKLKLTS